MFKAGATMTTSAEVHSLRFHAAENPFGPEPANLLRTFAQREKQVIVCFPAPMGFIHLRRVIRLTVHKHGWTGQQSLLPGKV